MHKKQAFLNTTRAFKKSLPILMGVLMLLALADALIPKQAPIYMWMNPCS